MREADEKSCDWQAKGLLFSSYASSVKFLISTRPASCLFEQM